MTKYELGKSELGKWNTITDPKANYTLMIYITPLGGGSVMDVYFNVPTPGHPSIPLLEGSRIPITGREIIRYPEFVRHISLREDHQYVEVGAGHGDFTPNLVRKFNGSLQKRPIVIDPVNYNIMYDMMSFALENIDLYPYTRQCIQQLIERNRIISDPTKVRLINMRLSDAVQKNPELIGSADVLIDSAAALTYPETELKEDDLAHPKQLRKIGTSRVQELEMSLLKPNGEYFHF